MKYVTSLITIFVIIYFLFEAITITGENMNLKTYIPRDQQALEFKQEVGYQQAIENAKDKTEGVLLNWLDKSPIVKILEEEGWEKGNEYHYVSHMRTYWDIGENKEAVSIDISASTSDNKEPIEWIMLQCLNTSMMEIPYEKGPEIGHFSVVGGTKHLYWTYHNLSIQLIQNENYVDAYKIGMKIQRILEEHVVKNISDYAPKIQELTIFQQEIYVNTPFEITVIPQTFSRYNKIKNNAHEMDDIKYVGSKEEHQTKTYTFKALKPGDYTFVFTLGDLNTLLSSKKSIKVTILPSVDSPSIQQSSK